MDAEFPTFPDKFKKFTVTPKFIENQSSKPFDTTIKLRNISTYGVLFKVKCTSNRRIRLDNCAEILGPDEEVDVKMTRRDVEPDAHDNICVVYALVGDCWLPKEKRNAFQAWLRATSQQISTRNMVIAVGKA